jgi:CO/xanthine dehydrogenase Mo-binding subunit
MRTALNAAGEMIARDVVVEMDNGAYSAEMPWLASLPLHILGAIYKINGPTRITSRLWYTNTAPTGAFRGVGGTYLYMALERHTDNIANSIGVDRLKFRLLQLIGDGAVSHVGQTLHDAGILREGFNEIQKVMNWEQTIASLKPFQGIGIASGLWLTNPMPGQATVKLNEDGTVSVITGATENGSGAVAMGITQIVAQELGVDANDVSVSMPDTDISGYDAGSQGSRTTHIVGRAALNASIEVKRQVLERASNLLEIAVADLQISNGLISVVGTPSISISLGEVATNALWAVGPIAATSSYTTPPIPFDPGCASGLLFPTLPTPTYHVHMAVVEVDPVTGGVKILRYVVVQEVGKAINPIAVRGQIQGAVAQGVGLTLYESLRIGKDCRYLERTLESYRLPIALDVPDVEFILMEHPDESGPFGAKGVAEPAVVFVPAAVLNAVSHAIGRNVTSIPLTPECVLDLIEGKP